MIGFLYGSSNDSYAYLLSTSNHLYISGKGIGSNQKEITSWHEYSTTGGSMEFRRFIIGVDHSYNDYSNLTAETGNNESLKK